MLYIGGTHKDERANGQQREELSLELLEVYNANPEVFHTDDWSIYDKYHNLMC